MRRSRQTKSGRLGRIRRIGAVFAAIVVAISLASQFYQPTAEAGVTTWPGSAEAIAVTGGTHTCAVASDDWAYCWGNGGEGKLGNGSTGDQTTPVAISQGTIPSGATIRQIAAGTHHTCALASDDWVYCWGSHYNARLGRSGVGSSQMTPVDIARGAIPAGVTIKHLSIGNNNGCVIASNDRAYCWGYNNRGQLGDGTTSMRTTPVAVLQGSISTGANFKQVSIGNSHMCAIATDDWAYCWGRGDNFDSLGDGLGIDQNTPVAVAQGAIPAGLTLKQISVAINGYHSCVIASNDKAYCWGRGSSGRLGNNSTSTQPTPVAVLLGGLTIQSITAGQDHTCAIDSNSNAYCWGSGTNGRLGRGSTAESRIPALVSRGSIPAGADIQQIIAAATYSCAIASSQVYCWGDNANGRLGDGSTTERSTPVAVRSLDTPLTTSSYRFYENANSATPGDPLAGTDKSAQLAVSGGEFRLRQGINNGVGSGREGNVTDISTGSEHACVIAGGQAYCWGANTSGQLGNNSTASSLLPVPVDTSGVLAGKTVTAISAGNSRTCAVADGAAYCWGAGSLGDGSSADSPVPVAVTSTGVLAGKTVTEISTAGVWSCVIADGAAYCWGSTTPNPSAIGQGQLPVGDTLQYLDGARISQSPSFSQFCATSSSAGLYCIVLYVSYNLSLAQSSTKQASNSGDHACVLQLDDWVSCRGVGEHGQLGNGSTSDSLSVSVPISQGHIPVGATIQHVSVEGSSSCAIADDLAYCWGNNDSGQLGNDSTAQSNVPYAVDASGALAGKIVTAISTSASYVCAVADGVAYCWGNNDSGQLGNDSYDDSLVPVAVGVSVGSGEEDEDTAIQVTKVSAGNVHACAVAEGAAYCWGNGDNGRLGNNSVGQSFVPAAVDVSGVLGGKEVTDIVAGTSHTCAIADGAAYCWGLGTSGQLGNNAALSSSVPVAVDTAGVLSGKTVTSISVGDTHTCAIADGAPYCWGANTYGQLGDNSTTSSNTPVAVVTSGVLSGKTIASLHPSIGVTCAVADGWVYCWGGGSTVFGPVPTAIPQGDLPPGSIIKSVSISGMVSPPYTIEIFGLILDGNQFSAMMAYIPFGIMGAPTPPQGLIPSEAEQIVMYTNYAINDSTYCAIISDGAQCISNMNTHGQAGNGTSGVDTGGFVAVSQGDMPSGAVVEQITMGSSFVCAIADGSPYCWGLNDSGQLGDDTASNKLVPTAVGGALFGGGASSPPPIPPSSLIGSTIIAGDNDFVLQYTTLTAATCSLQTTGFAAVTASTPIAFNTNADVVNGAAITTGGSDPTNSASTMPQVYRSAEGSFTNTSDIPPGYTGLFDFSLKDNDAAANTTYCLRIAYSDGSPIENATAYAEVTMANGMLLIDIVDNGGSAVASPSFAMTPATVQAACQAVTGAFGTDSQQIRIFNSLSSTGWSVNIAATNGPTALWSSGTASYDFNDVSGSPPGCNSGSDGDGIAGGFGILPEWSTITPQAECAVAGLSRGSQSMFEQGALDAITLLAASTLTPLNCNYYLTDIMMAQVIPANQPAGSYSINMTVTVVAQ